MYTWLCRLSKSTRRNFNVSSSVFRSLSPFAPLGLLLNAHALLSTLNEKWWHAIRINQQIWRIDSIRFIGFGICAIKETTWNWCAYVLLRWYFPRKCMSLNTHQNFVESHQVEHTVNLIYVHGNCMNFLCSLVNEYNKIMWHNLNHRSFFASLLFFRQFLLSLLFITFFRPLKKVNPPKFIIHSYLMLSHGVCLSNWSNEP